MMSGLRLPARWAVTGLGAVLVILAGFALWGVLTTNRAAADVTRTSAASDAFADARYSVGQEESLERKYRLEPSPRIADLHTGAANDMVVALTRARGLADAEESADADEILGLQSGYLAAIHRMFRAVDRGQTQRVLALDAGQVDPRFARIEIASDRAAKAAGDDTQEALAGLRSAENLVLVGTPIAFAVGLLMLAFFVQILVAALRTSRSQAEENRHMAMHDALTGLPNRVLFNDRLAQAMRDAKRERQSLAVIMVDLDRFKEINDTLGHANGDALLVQVSSRLREALRDRDTLARLGGDEFAVLLAATDAAGAGRVAENLHRSLETAFALPSFSVDAPASFGIACYPEDGTDPETLVQHADVAMYLAKDQHVGQAFYNSARDPYDPDRLALVGELRRAISDDELVLHYQPKLDLKTGEITGVEALVRWDHPVRGLLAPDVFVPLAEHTGMIGPLTLWVLDRALGQCAAWRRDGRDLSVSVNLAAQSLLDALLTSDITRLLERHGVPPSRLELELTESSLMSDPGRSIAVLEQLSAMGIRLSIDDFGTGYSSLSYLKRLPVDEIKIDKSFVMGMEANADDAVIVRSTIDLGRNLGLRVVAEGVETERALSGLRTLGCDSAQGFLLSRPVVAAELEAWFATQADGRTSRMPA